MKLFTLQKLAAAVACVGMIIPTAALAGDASKQVKPGIDIALSKGGLFVGQVVDAQGVAQAKSEVSIRYQGKEVVRTTTDKNGVFAAKGLRGGQYEVVAANHSAPVRMWASKTAPPSARGAAMIVTGSQTANAQFGGGGFMSWVQAHPMIVTGCVVAAVATPIAIAAADDDDSSS